MGRVLLLAALAAAGACYKPPPTECIYQCNAETGCPAGLACASGYCVEPGSGTVCGDDGDGGGLDARDDDGSDNPDAPLPTRKYRLISVGNHHACAIDVGGELWCWGANDARQLGVATVDDYAAQPQHVLPAMADGDWTAIAAGGAHTCGLFAPGIGGQAQLWCWGENFSYQTGTSAGSPTTPHQVAVPAGYVWRQIALGGQHTCAVVENTTDQVQTVRCFGANGSYQLGTAAVSGMTAAVTAIDDTGIAAAGTRYRSLTAGTDHTCVIGMDDHVYCWGDNNQNECGVSNGSMRVPVAVLGGFQFSTVAAGDSFTCGVDMSNSSLRCWGRNSANELGIGPGPNQTTPASVVNAGTGAKWKALALGQYSACGIQGPPASIDSIGTVRCWGANEFGERGDGSFDLATPGPQAAAADGAFAIGAGHQSACALVGDPVLGGELRCWGDNADGQIGTGVASDHRRPIRVGEGVRAGQDWLAVSAGRAHTCAILGTRGGPVVNRKLYCWGNAASGQIDTVLSLPRRAPVRVTNGDGAMDVVVGSNHTCVLRELASPPGARQIQCWGSDEGKQLGTAGNQQPGPTILSLDPFFPTGLRGAGNVSCGVNPSGVQCWGEAELASAYYINSDMPAAPSTIGTATPNETVSIGPSSACWIDTGNSQTLCFGTNVYGQLGWGMSATPTSHPQPVMGLTDATALSRGPSNHRCAITTNRVAKCWGANGYNQAGIGDGMDKIAPVTVQSPNQFDAIATGLNHTCGLDGSTIFCWGNNDQYQRTAIASMSSLPPAAITAPQGEAAAQYQAVTAGEFHTCAISVQGALYCWGASRWGQVGAGTASEPTPLPVIDGTP